MQRWCKRISGDVYPETRFALTMFLEKIIVSAEHAKERRSQFGMLNVGMVLQTVTFYIL